MVTFSLLVKSGTGGYSDYDACDLVLLKKIEAETLPRIGEKISFGQKVKEKYVVRVFLVTDINHHVNLDPNKKVFDVTVCGIPVDGMPALLEP